ncbi:unnamed protein product [Arctogadus glacialis]
MRRASRGQCQLRLQRGSLGGVELSNPENRRHQRNVTHGPAGVTEAQAVRTGIEGRGYQGTRTRTVSPVDQDRRAIGSSGTGQEGEPVDQGTRRREAGPVDRTRGERESRPDQKGGGGPVDQDQAQKVSPGDQDQKGGGSSGPDKARTLLLHSLQEALRQYPLQQLQGSRSSPPSMHAGPASQVGRV